MIQKCPNCGTWCETEGSGMLQRFSEGWMRSVENAGRIVGGDNIVGNMLGGAIGTYTGTVRGGFEALFGDKYQFCCPNCGCEWGTDDEDDDETDELLEEIEQEQNEFYSSVQGKIDEYINADQPKKAIKYLETLINDPNNEDELAFLYRKEALIYINDLDDNEAALTACERGLKAIADKEWSSDDTFLYYFKYIAEQNLDRIWTARRDALIVYQQAEDEKVYTDEGPVPLEEVAEKAFNSLDAEYADKYLSFDYKERKALLTVPSISDAGTTHVDVFHISSLPNNIAFPVGHPVVNQVYIGHPYLPELYLPIETYQYAFVEDRVREFCEIAQALGATEITVEALNSSNTSQNGSRDRRASGGASYSGHSANGSYQDNNVYGSVEQKYQALNFHQEYDPSEPVHLPEKTVWYPHESSWQRLYKQRLKGILSHEERIETRKSQVLSGSELKEIKGEVKTIFEANGEWDESMEEKFVQEENAVLSIRVKFAPLSQLTEKRQQQPRQTHISQEEQEYLEMYNEYAATGALSDINKKMLDKFRKRLGISEERAHELEISCAEPQLTEDEKEYLEMYKAKAADGKISELDRKLLNKLRNSMGISEERAKEIEKTLL